LTRHPGALVVFLAALGGYAASAGDRLWLREGGRHYVHLARSFVHGRLSFLEQPSGTHDLTQHAGEWYVPFPPLPAVLLAPLVALWELGVYEVAASVALGALNCALVWVMLGRLNPPTSTVVRVAMTVLFGFGTVHWYSTLAGSVWFFAHVVAVTFATLYAVEVLGRNRPLLAGLTIGMASLARPATLLAFPLFLARAYQQGRAEGWDRGRWARELVGFAAPVAAAIVVMAVYNTARFGSPVDFGYASMTIADQLRPRLQEHGQFALAFLPDNLYYFLLAPPWVDTAAPWPNVTFSAWGAGLLFVSPALFLGVRGLGSPVGRGAAAAASLVAIPNLLYYNTGWVQFGYRFGLDFLPFLLVLAALGARGRLSWAGAGLVALSIASNLYGMLWFFGRLPVRPVP
jgi:hypothetical protein